MLSNLIAVPAACGSLEAMKFMISLPGVDVLVVCANDNKAITLAAREGHLEIVKLLMGVDGVRYTDLTVAIMLAKDRGFVEIEKVLTDSF
ncbi:hypothetical protein HDU76_001043 [Blyttiomyces sp. JEL0837]|nr:hypothetical protein HDU76_001043 [Blyttiomyces sp. JEL0837]